MTACITGWAHTEFGRLEGETVESLVTRVTKDALTDAGLVPGEAVTRVEFQLRREALRHFSVETGAELLAARDGLWAYGTQDWIRLASPQKDHRIAFDFVALSVYGLFCF